jgi:hypothetical protein
VFGEVKLLGDWNWWLPRKLDWLPQVELEGAKAWLLPRPAPDGRP